MYRAIYKEYQRLEKTDPTFLLLGTAEDWEFIIFDKGGICYFESSTGVKMMQGEGSITYFKNGWYSDKDEFRELYPQIYNMRSERPWCARGVGRTAIRAV